MKSFDPRYEGGFTPGFSPEEGGWRCLDFPPPARNSAGGLDVREEQLREFEAVLGSKVRMIRQHL